MKEYTERIVEILREGGKVSIPTDYLTDNEVKEVLALNEDITLNKQREFILK